MKLKEWEEKFDQEQKIKEHKEILKDEKLRQRETNKFNVDDNALRTEIKSDENLTNELSSKLESLDVDKSSEH